MNKFKVETYVKENGDNPVKEFVSSLTEEMQSKFVHMVDLLTERGNQLREPYSEYLEDGIFELRYKNDEQAVRVLFFFYYEGRIILTNGFIKKTRKTPRKEIKKAKDYRNDFLERQKNES